MFLSDEFNRKEYREYAEKELDVKRMMEQYNNQLGIE
jgi:hypothetical protein